MIACMYGPQRNHGIPSSVTSSELPGVHGTPLAISKPKKKPVVRMDTLFFFSFKSVVTLIVVLWHVSHLVLLRPGEGCFRRVWSKGIWSSQSASGLVSNERAKQSKRCTDVFPPPPPCAVSKCLRVALDDICSTFQEAWMTQVHPVHEGLILGSRTEHQPVTHILFLFNWNYGPLWAAAILNGPLVW